MSHILWQHEDILNDPADEGQRVSRVERAKDQDQLVPDFYYPC